MIRKSRSIDSIMQMQKESQKCKYRLHSLLHLLVLASGMGDWEIFACGIRNPGT